MLHFHNTDKSTTDAEYCDLKIRFLCSNSAELIGKILITHITNQLN